MIGKRESNFWSWLADIVPRKLVYFCAIKLGVYATTGDYSSQVVPELSFMTALKRWGVE